MRTTNPIFFAVHRYSDIGIPSWSHRGGSSAREQRQRFQFPAYGEREHEEFNYAREL